MFIESLIPLSNFAIYSIDFYSPCDLTNCYYTAKLDKNSENENSIYKGIVAAQEVWKQVRGIVKE